MYYLYKQLKQDNVPLFSKYFWAQFDPTGIKNVLFLHHTPAFQPVSDCVLEHVSQLIGAEKEALKRVHREVLTENLSLYP